MSENRPPIEPVLPAPRTSDGARHHHWVQWILDHFPPGQFGRYLVVGLVNTGFGYGTYAGLTALLAPHIRFAYMVASVVSGVLNITYAFLNYKWFIFKTKGNYLREWSRCIVVYGGTMMIGTIILPLTVFLVRHLTAADRSAPYIAGALQMSANVVAGFLGHKHFSFASPKGSPDTPGERLQTGESSLD
jgi:putative flippase GtrA